MEYRDAINFSFIITSILALSGCGDPETPSYREGYQSVTERLIEESKRQAEAEKAQLEAAGIDSSAAQSDGQTVDRGPLPHTDLLPVTKEIYEKFNQEEQAFESYEVSVPERGSIRMVPIEGGEFLLGSPESDPNHQSDEGPQRKVSVSSFWMSETEVTWALYRAFMENGDPRNKDGTLKSVDSEDPLSKIVSQPTPPYTPMHFDMGGGGYADEYPAIGMTQHAASKFCEWLSAQTGEYYRLPTAAEWEYACRAGTTTAYFFGDDPAQLGEYAWYFENSDFEYQAVKQKKPNPWGLYDVHGNVAEWVLDRYTENGYTDIADGAQDPWQQATARYPREVRGGHWDQDPEDLRSAARMASDPNWKAQDPQIPKSIWYHTDALWLGFRIIRPVRIPSLEDVHRYWNTGPGEAM